MRHARPAASWGEDPDPGLDPVGITQAQTTAERLGALQPQPVYSSPLRRCRETAAPLGKLWHRELTIFPQVAEIPSPPALDGEARRQWLTAAMEGSWVQLHENAPPGSGDYLQWRHDLLKALAAVPHDCVIYTHYIALNVVVGAALERDEVICFRPDHASVTIIDARASTFELVELGAQAQTSVLSRG